MIRFWLKPFEGIDLSQHWDADLTRLDYFLNALNYRIEMAVVSDAKLYIVCATSRDHAIAFADVQSHGLLAHHMLPCF